MSRILAVSAAFFLLTQTVCSLHLIGTTITSNDFTYIGKFAYGDRGGRINIQTGYGSIPGYNIDGQVLALFPDVVENWDTIEDNPSLSCHDKLAYAGKTVYNIGTQAVLTVSGRRPHFWYLVLANCQDTNTTTAIDAATGLPIVVSVNYDISLTNSGDAWTEEVSWDQQHIAEISIAFLIFYTLLFALLVHGVTRTMRTVNRPLFIGLSVAVFFQIMHQILTLSYQMEGIKSGTYTNAINQASWWFDTLAILVLLALVMLSAAGVYTTAMTHTSTNMMSRLQSAIVIGMMTLYVAAYIAAFVVGTRYEEDHPSMNNYFFNNWAGYWLCALRIVNIGMVFFLLNLAASQHSTQFSSRMSYMVFGLFAFVWLGSFPVITLIGSMMAAYWRPKAIYCVDSIVFSVAISVQYFMYHPYRKTDVVKSTSSREQSVNHRDVSKDTSMVELSIPAENGTSSAPASPRSPSSFGQVIPA